VLGRDWLNTLPEMGPVLAVACEDDADELHRRLSLILGHCGATFADLKDLHLLSLAGQDALLAAPDRNGLIKPTNLFNQIHAAACDTHPKLIVLDKQPTRCKLSREISSSGGQRFAGNNNSSSACKLLKRESKNFWGRRPRGGATFCTVWGPTAPGDEGPIATLPHEAATNANWNIHSLHCSRFMVLDWALPLCGTRARRDQRWVYYGVFTAIEDARFLQRVLMILASDNRVLSKVSELIATSARVGVVLCRSPGPLLTPRKACGLQASHCRRVLLKQPPGSDVPGGGVKFPVA
jgi:hypothetical protein